MLWRIGIILGLAVLADACSSGSDCARPGCDALTARASGSGTGISGIGASESDVVSNGCRKCPFSGAQLAFWKIDVPTTPEDDIASTSGTQAIAGADASPSYLVMLDPGTYVVRTRADAHCIETTVSAGQLTTVNVNQGFGPVGFWIVEPATGRFVEDFGIARP